MGNSKEMIEREVTYKEFLQESEGKYKFFRLKYTELHNEIINHVREYQSKNQIMRLLESPTISTFKITVIECVDNG